MPYIPSEIKDAAMKYFDNDELAANVWIAKYSLKNASGEILEKTPEEKNSEDRGPIGPG